MPHEETYESGTRGKQRQKNVTKKVEYKVEKSGEQVYFNISSNQYKSLGGSKFWLLFVDKHTGYKKSYFLSWKSQMSSKDTQYQDRHFHAQIYRRKYKI